MSSIIEGNSYNILIHEPQNRNKSERWFRGKFVALKISIEDILKE